MVEAWQAELFSLGSDVSLAGRWDDEATKRTLDELFCSARRYRSRREYDEVLRFVTAFPYYSPFNAMLIHTQMPGATYVAPPSRWLRDFGRTIRPGARPLTILQPGGPVMFVFDVSDTDEGEHAVPLPAEVTEPFRVRAGCLAGELEYTLSNVVRDGVAVHEQDAGSGSAGSIQAARGGRALPFQVKWRPEARWVEIPRRYALILNAKHSAETRYATLVHELGHLYCGHVGTPEPLWWPDRQGLEHAIREFEAESISYLVCARLGIDSPADAYLSGYLEENGEVPEISLDCVIGAASLIERMGRERLKPRKRRKKGRVSPRAGAGFPLGMRGRVEPHASTGLPA